MSEAELVGEYMIRPLLSLERLTFLEPEGKAGYRWGRDGAEQETMDSLDFIARVTSHIPDKGQAAVIDIAARPDAYCRWGQKERFMGWSGYLPRREKSNFLSSNFFWAIC
jgi:hypothetical protein